MEGKGKEIKIGYCSKMGNSRRIIITGNSDFRGFLGVKLIGLCVWILEGRRDLAGE